MQAEVIARGFRSIVTSDDLECIEGRDAWVNAGTDAHNPHIPGSLDWAAWQHGYDAARATELAKQDA